MRRVCPSPRARVPGHQSLLGISAASLLPGIGPSVGLAPLGWVSDADPRPSCFLQGDVEAPRTSMHMCKRRGIFVSRCCFLLATLLTLFLRKLKQAEGHFHRFSPPRVPTGRSGPPHQAAPHFQLGPHPHSRSPLTHRRTCRGDRTRSHSAKLC